MMYFYARVSTARQSLDRQLTNLKHSDYACATVYQEKFTGTKLEGRTEFEKLLKRVKQGDTIIFDSVSRMSRNAEEGIAVYMELYEKGVDLVFLKEPHINTDTYKSALQNVIETTGNEIADIYIEATNKVLKMLAEKQIRVAFEQAEKEAADIKQRVIDGMASKAEQTGKTYGRKKGDRVITERQTKAKELIKKHCKDFGGNLSNLECMELAHISKATFYKYRSELKPQ